MPTLNHTPTRRPWMRERKPHERRTTPNRELYNGQRWRKLAKQHKMANPWCVACEKAPAEVTDHIRPVNQGGAMYDWDNLQSLCNRCHNIKSGKEAHKQ